MGIDQTRRSLNQLDKEIVDLEKKLADEAKKEADKTKRINDTNKSITKNTSTSMLNSKMRQIQGYQDELVKIASNKAEINGKIADKRKKRADTAVKLQKEENEEVKKQQKAQSVIYNDYEKKIADLTFQLTNQITTTTNKVNPVFEKQEEVYDVFISHASEDKESFVNDLVNELQELGIKVWYDVLIIKWGDSLRRKIDDGLKKSRFGIVVISKDYIKKFWTNVELDGLFQIEMYNGKTILPIWHNISKKEVQEFSPTIAGRLALNTTIMNANEIAIELLSVLGLDNTEDKTNG